MVKNLCIIQGRINSQRLPGKIMLKLDKKNSIIQFLIKRLNTSKKIDKIIFATSKKKENKIIENHLKNLNCSIFFGEDKNVLLRFYDAARKFKPKNIIRITSDCPFVDPKIIDEMCYKHIKNYDYSFNNSSFLMEWILRYLNILKKAKKSAKLYMKKSMLLRIKN